MSQDSPICLCIFITDAAARAQSSPKCCQKVDTAGWVEMTVSKHTSSGSRGPGAPSPPPIKLVKKMAAMRSHKFHESSSPPGQISGSATAHYLLHAGNNLKVMTYM